ncbi:MAG: hypothetical protein ACR2PZ_21280 [Pseudomonadales bacterium]
MGQRIQDKVRDLRIAHGKHVRAESGASRALAFYEALTRKKKLRNAAANNAYIQLCIDERDLERIDAFVEDYAAIQKKQEIPAFEDVFEYLFSELDNSRLVRYGQLMPSLGRKRQQFEIDNEWLLEINRDQSAEKTQREFDRLSELAQQVWIRMKVQKGDTQEIADMFARSLFEPSSDKRVEALKCRNAQDLKGLAHPIVDAFLKHLPKDEAEKSPHNLAPAPLRDNHLDWKHFVTEAIATSLIIRHAHSLSRKNVGMCLKIYEKRIRDTRARSDHLINEYLVQADKFGRSDVVHRLGAILDQFSRPINAGKRELPGLVTILKKAFRSDDEERLTELEVLLPFLNDRLRQEYVQYKHKSSRVDGGSTPKNLSKLAGEVPPLVAQQNVAALTEMNQLDEAVELLTESLFQPSENHAIFKAKIKNLTLLTRYLRKSNPVFQAFVDSQVISRIDRPENHDWSLLFALNGYYAGTGRHADSLRLLRKTDFSALPTIFAKTLLVWMTRHDSHDKVANYFEFWHRRERSADSVATSYAIALHNNNQLEEACSLLQGRSDLAAITQLATTLAALGRSDEAFEALSKRADSYSQQETYWVRLAGICPASKLAELSVIWREAGMLLEDRLRDRILLQIAILDGSLRVDWDRHVGALRTKYSDKAAIQLMGTAFARGAGDAFRQAFDCFLAHAPCSDKYFQKPYLQQVVRLLYRNNAKSLVRMLQNEVSFAGYDLNFEMTKEFGLGNALQALDARSDMVLEALNEEFDKVVDPSKRGDKIIACAERQLAGEFYCSFFFQTEFAIRGSFMVVCDERLLGIYRRTFPNIEFSPKTPRYKISTAREEFRGVPLQLADYVDARSFELCKQGTFFPFTIREAYPEAVRIGNRSNGWLLPDERLVSYWKQKFAEVHGGLLVGFSSSSTQRSPIRDHQIVELEHWQSLYALPHALFVNLNPALSRAEVTEIGEQYAINTFTPDFDLFNDFENLLALMSALDLAILPANSLMDIAASVGLRTFVFSPSGMMSNWTVPETKRYIFSDSVEFFCGDESVSTAELVEHMALAIREEFASSESEITETGVV